MIEALKKCSGIDDCRGLIGRSELWGPFICVDNEELKELRRNTFNKCIQIKPKMIEKLEQCKHKKDNEECFLVRLDYSMLSSPCDWYLK
jgi:hypothetical protein